MVDFIQAILSESPPADFWKCYYRLKFKDYNFNHKRVHRVYYRLGLNLKRRVKKALPEPEKKPLSVVNKPNIQWAMDFMHDALYCGKPLNIIAEGTREYLTIEVNTSLPAGRVIRELERLKEESRLPQQNRLMEWFNGSFRREFLNAYLFQSLSQVSERAWFWLQDYNLNRTHESLGHLPPDIYRKQLENSTQGCLR